MTNELFINGTDASTHKVFMGKDFLNKLLAPCEMKSYITNDSALEHGRRYIADSPKMDERSITLTFNIHGDTKKEYLENKDWLLRLFYAGGVTIRLPSVSNEIYKLLYTGKSISYNQDVLMLNGTITAGFVEYNPSDRPIYQ